jgi:hypothetical protein
LQSPGAAAIFSCVYSLWALSAKSGAGAEVDFAPAIMRRREGRRVNFAAAARGARI